MKKGQLRFVVQHVRDGPHGPFAIATADTIKGSVTFSLTPPVWKERSHPGPGTEVVLSDIRRKRAGWRAERGRYLRLSDVEHESKQALSKDKHEFRG